ncbi:MAG TPA: alpha/beta fold hydrolase, partial [Nocardioides sp.]|nr:alpha/beta fold hydrolase [Nocardioides sp.]
MSLVDDITRAPVAALEFANILLTQSDAKVGATPKEVVWTHRKTTLYRYRSERRKHAIPVLLVFALINRPDIFDLRSGNSFVEFLLDEGFDVFLIDWGYPDQEDAEMGLEEYVCDELHWGIRETLRHCGQDELSLLGWCIGGTLCLLHAGWCPRAENPVRNMVLLTTPVDPTDSLYATWVGPDSFDVDFVADGYQAIPGQAVDWA